LCSQWQIFSAVASIGRLEITALLTSQNLRHTQFYINDLAAGYLKDTQVAWMGVVTQSVISLLKVKSYVI
jgi:hypothetical protein